MLKYLPKDKQAISELVDSRSKDSDLAIVFNQDLSELIKTVYETCQNMVKIAQDQNGNILIDEYAMDDVTPSSDMKEKMFTKVGTEIMEQLYRFCKDDYSELFKIEYGSDKNSYLPIDNVSNYETSLLSTIDSSIRDMFIYGVLNAWFTAVNSDVLKAMATSEYAKAKDIFLRSLKPLYRKYKFNKVNSYV
jgi:hypothetical protein